MKKVGIVIAMQEEYEEIEKIITDQKKEQIRFLTFTIGKIENIECVVVQCGVGKVNAARATQVMIDSFELEYIINIGTAGAINETLEIGDILIGKQVVQHDFDITAFGHKKGYITGVGNEVICDKKLVNKFQNIIQNMAKEEYQIKLGVVATGDIFCTETKMKDKIRKKFEADVVDMECGAIAQVAHLNQIPFIVIRGISDTPNGNNAKAFDENLKFASKRCADILKKVVV